MADLRKELPPGVDLDSLSRDARNHAEELLEEFCSWDEIPHFAVKDHEIMVIYLQDHLEAERIRSLMAEQRNKVKKFLLEDDMVGAYEDVGRELDEIDLNMATDIFVDDMRLLNRYNQFFGEIHSVLDDVEDEYRDQVRDELMEKVVEDLIDEIREELKERFPEGSDELQDKIGSPFEGPQGSAD